MVAPHFSPSLSDAKRILRRRMLAARVGLDPIVAGLALGASLMRTMPPRHGATVAGFWPLGTEIDIRPLLFALHLKGHPIALPETPPPGMPLSFRLWVPGAPMRVEPFGTCCPTGPLVTPDVLLVPLLAFDGACRRLGYGGGYYDRTLVLLSDAVAIGCAFKEQAVDIVPTGPYDVPLRAVATDAGVIGEGLG